MKEEKIITIEMSYDDLDDTIRVLENWLNAKKYSKDMARKNITRIYYNLVNIWGDNANKNEEENFEEVKEEIMERTIDKTEDEKYLEIIEEKAHVARRDLNIKLFELIWEKVTDEELRDTVEYINNYSNKHEMYKSAFIGYMRDIILDNVTDFAEFFKEISNENI